MDIGINFYSLLYTMFFTLCSGFVLISSAAGQTGQLNLYVPGESLVYQWKSTVLLDEVDKTSKNVGFLLDGQVTLTTVWQSRNKKLLKVEINSPQLHVKSRKAPVPEGFIPHSSNLNTFSNKPFGIIWNQGIVDKVLISKDEPLSLKNLKKGVASLLQVQMLNGESSETDSSGHCTTKYSSSSSAYITKTKFSCTSLDTENMRHIDALLGSNVASTRNTELELDESSKFFKSIIAKEFHQIHLEAKKELGGLIETEQILFHTETKPSYTIEAGSLEKAIIEFSTKEQIQVLEESLLTEKEEESEGHKKFNKEVDLLRNSLKTDYLGSLKAAKAFLQLLKVARDSGSEEISKALSSKKNDKILGQLYDILGYTQTKHSHKAVMKKLHLDSEENIDNIERYLWALSFSTHPNVDIVEDLLNKYRKYTNIPEHVKDTLILSLASMAKSLAKSGKHDYETSKVIRNVQETIINGLDYAKDEERYVFFNALKNLQSPGTLPNLISYVKNGTLKEEVLAWRAIKSFDKQFWSEDILKLAKKTLFQLDKKHDTSARTLTADILLQEGPDDQALVHMLNFIIGNETNYEIKQYVFQSIRMLTEKDETFKERVENIIKGSKKLNNYSGLSPRGLSTALSRKIFSSSSSNGSIVSIQEIKGGIVKRGVVDVVLEKDGLSKELFTLGIFCGGLTNFMSNNNNEADDEETEESATAGLELSVLGTLIRPFVFFEGQGELMGHLWSGTASEMTPAFQALILLQDHKEYIRLGNGFIAETDVKGPAAFDLSGKISTSLWNRNSEALIEKSLGYVNSGLIKIKSPFVTSELEFEASIEPKLVLQMDADFSANVKLCLRLSQPDFPLMQKIVKTEKIPGSKYQLKITKNKKSNIQGITYALNRKNNNMCSAMFT